MLRENNPNVDKHPSVMDGIDSVEEFGFGGLLLGLGYGWSLQIFLFCWTEAFWDFCKGVAAHALIDRTSEQASIRHTAALPRNTSPRPPPSVTAP